MSTTATASSPGSRLGPSPIDAALLGLGLAWFAIVVVAPLAALIDLATPLTLSPTERVALLRAVGRGLVLAFTVASASTLLAVLLARTVAPVLLLGLLMLGRFVVAHGMLALGLAPGAVPASLALIIDLTPFAAMLVILRLRTRPTALLEAAADLGADRLTRLREVDWPHLRPALLIAWVWCLLQALGDVIALELAGGGHVYTLGLLIRDGLVHDEAPGRALVGILGLLALALPCAVAIARELGHAPDPRPNASARPWLRALGLVVFAALLLGPARLLFGAQPPGWGPSDRQLGELLGQTATLAGVVAVLASTAGFAAALALRRAGSSSSATFVTALILTPLAIPPSVLGMLMLAAATRWGWAPGVVLTVVALLGPALALGFVAARVLISAIPTAWPDAIADLGAGPRDRLRLLWWPLARPAWVVAAAVVFAWVVGQAAIPAWTSGPGGDTLAVALTIHARAGAIALVRRWSLILVVTVLSCVIVIGRVTRWRRR